MRFQINLWVGGIDQEVAPLMDKVVMATLDSQIENLIETKGRDEYEETYI